jgi:sirohydrochlorin cobaltochelatase
MRNKAIVVVSFGSSYEEARKKNIEPLENLIQDNFKDYKVVRAFTSNIILRKLKRSNIHIDTPKEALSKLINDGYEEIIVQPSHIIPGYEYEKIKQVVDKINNETDANITLGRPLIYYNHDYELVIDALKSYIPKDIGEDEKILLMGHGTEHYANACYYYLQHLLKEKELPIIIGTVEEGIDVVIGRLQKENCNKVALMPFMLVAGDHAQNDMAGDDEDSWKNTLLANSIDVRIFIQGLGENEAVRKIYLSHIEDVINNNEK